MPGRMLIEPLLVARSVLTTRRSSCKYKLEVQMSHPQRFTDVVNAANNGMTSRYRHGLMATATVCFESCI